MAEEPNPKWAAMVPFILADGTCADPTVSDEALIELKGQLAIADEIERQEQERQRLVEAANRPRRRRTNRRT